MTKVLEEKRLASLLFGTPIDGNSSAIEENHEADDSFEFELVEDKNRNDTEINEKDDFERQTVGKKRKKPVWQDEDDKDVIINVQENDRLMNIRKNVDEENITGAELSKRLKKKVQENSSNWHKVFENVDKTKVIASELFQNDTQLIDDPIISSTRFKANQVSIEPAPDANKHAPFYGEVRSVDWLPNSSLFMTAGGRRKTIKIFDIDGKTNKLVRSVKVSTLHDPTAKFSNLSKNEAIISGMNKHFYSMDVETGKLSRIPFISGRDERDLRNISVSETGKFFSICVSNGEILIMSKRNKSFVESLKMNGSALSADFSSCGNYLLSCGTDSSIYKWDLRNFECVGKQVDYASTGSTVVRFNPQNDNIYSTGATSGCVNVYNNSNFEGYLPETKPEKEALNVRTTVVDISFNKAGTLLAYCSDEVDNAVKILNMSDLSIVPTFPRVTHRLGAARCLKFSPDNKFLSIGNERGRCLLFRINNYT